MLVALTMLAGGFVAGTHAGLAYNTFPLMDGDSCRPASIGCSRSGCNLTENIAAVQFDHRLLATLTVLAACCTLIVGFAIRPSVACRGVLCVFGGAVALQYVLGVATLLLVVPVTLAAVHQAGALLLLTAAIALLHTARPAGAGRRS